MADAVYVVNGGLGLITGLLAGGSNKYVAWGTGATGAAVTDTAMQTAAAPTNATAVTGTSSQQQTTTANDTYRVVGTVTAAGTLAITEVGVFNQATLSGATCFVHGTFSAINVNSGDSIEFTINTVFDQA